MRTKCFLFLFASLICLHTAQAQEWSREIAVELPGQSMTTTPYFDIDPITNHLHIVSMMNPGVLYTEMDGEGTILKQQTIAAAAKDQGGLRFGATIAVDPNGRPHICYREDAGTNKYTSYYTYYDGSKWTTPVIISNRTYRGYVLPIDIASNGKAHIARGSATGVDPDPMIGPVQYYRFNNGNLEKTRDDITQYRCDDRIVINASYQNQVHLVLGCPDYPVTGGPVWYWRSFDGGETWTNSEIHNSQARFANGAPDLFVDASGAVHIVYGSESDFDRDKKPSVRYSRWQNNSLQFDIPITDAGEILPRFDTPQGFGSVAASADGQIVIIAYSEDFGAKLFAKESYDGGATWSSRTLLAQESLSSLGRNSQWIRATRDKFYVIYPTPAGVKLRYKIFSTNASPVAHIGGPYSANEGSQVIFNASQSYDPDGSIVKYEWDLNNDGIWEDVTSNPLNSRTFTDDYSGKAKVKVTDDESAFSIAETNLTIMNVAPTASAGGPYSGILGATINFNGTASDPGSDPLTFRWDLNNDGSYETNGQNVQKTYTTGGKYIVWLQVSDDDGGIGTDSATVSISVNPPVLSPIPNQVVDEGQAFTPVNLYKTVTDPDHTDRQIGWIFLGLTYLRITIQSDSLAYIAPVDSEWSGSEIIKFIATDPTQASDTSTATFTIRPVNDPPKISPIIVTPIPEGEVFEYIFLDNYVQDPDNKLTEILWSVQGQMDLQVTIDQRVAIVEPPHQDWFGSEDITFIATDQNGLGASDYRTATFTVQPVNDPPEITKILDQTIKYTQEFTPIFLDTCVSDVDTPPADIQWTFSGNKQLLMNISNRILTIEKPSAGWSGVDEITLVASDGQYSDNSIVKFTSVYLNEPPSVSGIPDQTINENGAFEIINLDNLVNDPNHADHELTWSILGGNHLKLEGLPDRMIYISVPDSEWSGSETVQFIVTDPDGLTDSDRATFTVIPINDPPKIRNVPDIVFNEDSSYTITINELKLMAFDPDNAFNDLKFALQNNRYTLYSIDKTGNLILSAEPNWNGVENAMLVVSDNRFAFNFHPIKITVNPTPDVPMVFNLLNPPYGAFYSVAPRTLTFSWEQAVDPDKGDEVHYTLNLSRNQNLSHILDQFNLIDNTAYSYTLPSPFFPGLYYWQVIAFDKDGHSTPCSRISVFNLEQGIAVETTDDTQIPKEFALLQNHPNPFNPETRITYHLPLSCHVKITVHNNLGQLVRILVDGEQKAGALVTTWDGRDYRNDPAPSGIYLYRIETEKFVDARKMLLLQ